MAKLEVYDATKKPEKTTFLKIREACGNMYVTVCDSAGYALYDLLQITKDGLKRMSGVGSDAGFATDCFGRVNVS